MIRSESCRGQYGEGIMRTLLGVSLFLAAAVPQEPGDAVENRLREADRRVLESLAKELERPASRPADPRARAELLGRDPARILAFVQKEIRFEPYPGLQRGPAGVLVSGAGNALDKSFLLEDLLRASGFEARMVQGTISHEQSLQLVKGWLESLQGRPESQKERPFGRSEGTKDRLEASCREAGVSVDEMMKILRADAQAQQAAWGDIKAIAAREALFLKSQQNPIDPGPLALAEPLVEDARHHAWVEWKTKDQTAWTTADACFSGAGPAATSEGVVDPALAADRFTVSLALERKTGDRRETAEVLKREVGAYEVLTEPLRFLIQPTDVPPPRPGEPFTSEEFYRRMAGAREFIAVVTVGEQPPGLMVFDYEGRISKPKMAAGKIGGSAGGAAGRVADLFGDPKKEEKSSLERLWVDLSMSRGGKTLWTQRRTILEEGARTTWCPVLTWDFLLPGGEISPEFARFVRVSIRLANQPVYDAVDDWARSKDGDLAKVSKVQVAHYPLGLLAFALARQAFVESAGARRPWMYFERPNVFLSGRQARLREKSRDVCLCQGIDLVDNGALVVEAGEECRVDRGATTALGAFDTVLEQAMLAEANVPESVVGALAFFERARLRGHPMRLIAPADAAGLQEAGVSKADAEWIGKRGDRVLVAAGMDPSHCGGTYAWWELDPRTGRALGRLAGGRGGCASTQELAEYMETISSFNNAVCASKVLGMLLGGKNEAAKDQAIDCLVGQFEGKMLEMSGLGVIGYVADLLEFKDNVAGK